MCAGEATCRMHACTSQHQSGDRGAVMGQARVWPKAHDLIEAKLAVKEVSPLQGKFLLQINRRPYPLSYDPRRAAWQVQLEHRHRRIRQRISRILRPAPIQIVCNPVDQDAGYVMTIWRQARVLKRRHADVQGRSAGQPAVLGIITLFHYNTDENLIQVFCI